MFGWSVNKELDKAWKTEEVACYNRLQLPGGAEIMQDKPH
jgi:hypothetical protein